MLARHVSQLGCYGADFKNTDFFSSFPPTSQMLGLSVTQRANEPTRRAVSSHRRHSNGVDVSRVPYLLPLMNQLALVFS